ncbi:hypothetical protein BCR35DRAFT_327658 [Leucosporidium creatinivorum]|uniref:Uncharacterized protein n=1 Tax=Leucosporidium creatinivorum TaxID=106004 RepID=A0A1Y2G3L6_9BASI|nr:hypothetical protein BCR35DRAFT_327658 [Leucosporidium creatinivorum]
MDDPLVARSPRSPPPKLDDEAPLPLPSLPTEILQRIIQLALPRLSFNTIPERCDLLLTLCRVNKLWAALAQEELYRHVRIKEDRAADALLATQHAQPAGGHRIHSVRFLLPSLDGDKSESNRLEVSQVESMLRALPELKKLYIVGEGISEPFIELGTLFPLLQGIQDLTIDYCTFVPSSLSFTFNPSSCLSLGRLRRLTLSFFDNPTDTTFLLSSAELPQLEELAILALGFLDNPEDMEALEAVLLHLGPQLKAFTICFRESSTLRGLSDRVWSSFKVLQNLTVNHNAQFETILPFLSAPAPLDYLRLLRPPFEMDQPPAVQNLSNTIAALPDTLVPQALHLCPSDAWSEESNETARHLLAELCSARGIELVKLKNRDE